MILAFREYHRFYNVSKNSTACSTRVISLPRKYLGRSSYTITVSEASSSQIVRSRSENNDDNEHGHASQLQGREAEEPTAYRNT